MPSLTCKPSVFFGGFTRELLAILSACLDAAHAFDLKLVITSGSDGKHMKGSRHYTFQAVDLRSKTLSPAMKAKVASYIRSRLGERFLVLLEHNGKANEHFHIELD